MAVLVTGELLAVNTRQWTNRDTGQVSDIREASLFDGGTVHTVSFGRDFPTSDFIELQREAANRPRVSLAVFVSTKGNLYAERLVDFAAAEKV